MRVSVTGGAGRLGNVLVRRLVERGDQVRVLEPGTHPLPALEGLDIELQRGSVLEPNDVAALVEGAELVFHTAAKIDLNRNPDPIMVKLNVEGTRTMVDACMKAGLRMVHTSSHAALDREPLSEPLTEENPLGLQSKCEYHRSKAVAETVVLDAVKRGLNAVIVNPGSMIGPYDFQPSMVGQALLDMHAGKIPIVLNALSDYVDVRDVADGMITAAERGRVGERYFLTGDVFPAIDMVKVFEEVSGRPMPKRSFPLWVGWLLVPFAELAAKFTDGPPVLTPNMLRASVSNEIVSRAKAERELGFHVRPLRESLADAVDWYGGMGWLSAT